MVKKHRVRVQIGIKPHHFIDIMRAVQKMEKDCENKEMEFDIEEGQFIDD